MAMARVAAGDDLWVGEMRGVVVEGRRILLVSLDDGVHAFEDRCRHKGVPLSEGKLENGVITCAVHGWCYDARTGRGVNPAGTALRRHAVTVREGGVYVDTEPGDAGG